MVEGVVVVQNAEGKIVACNRSANRILGLQEDQLNGRFCTDPFWHAIPRRRESPMVALKTNRSVRNVRMGLVEANNAVTWLSVNAEPIADPSSYFRQLNAVWRVK